MSSVRERAEEEAINVFARNLHDLLMAAPARLRSTMGLDPGLRTGKLVAIGNGTASREIERFFLDVQKQFPNVTAQ